MNNLITTDVKMTSLDMDGWLKKNYTKVQRDKIMFFSLRLLRGESDV